VIEYRLEVVTIPVSNVDRAIAFYGQQVGFSVDVDYHPADNFRVVQLTPPGSACSVQIGIELSNAPPGSASASYLVVADIEAARSELLHHGVGVSSIRHKSPTEDWKGNWQPGRDPRRHDFASFADFTDVDGNPWVVQETHSRKMT
jgi:predicted enzyme related to lactoylglutathione lyase